MLSTKEPKAVKPTRPEITSPIRFELSPICGDITDSISMPVVQSIFPDINIRFGAVRGFQWISWNEFLVEVDGEVKVLNFFDDNVHVDIRKQRGLSEIINPQNNLCSQFVTSDLPDPEDIKQKHMPYPRGLPLPGTKYTPFPRFHSHLWKLFTSVGLMDETVWSLVKFLLCLSHPREQCRRHNGPYVVFPDIVNTPKKLLLPEGPKTRLYELAKHDTGKVRNTTEGFKKISALWDLPEEISHTIMGYLYDQRALKLLGAPDIVLQSQQMGESVSFSKIHFLRRRELCKVYNSFSLSRLGNSIKRSETGLEASCYLQIDWGGGYWVLGGCQICLYETKLRLDEQTLSFEVTEILRHQKRGSRLS